MNTNGLLTVNTPEFIGTTGFLNTFSGEQIGSLKIKSANDFGSLTWLSLTNDSLNTSRTSLITLSSKIQNSGMIWDGTTTVHNNWGNSPTQIFPLVVQLELKLACRFFKNISS